MNQQPVTQQFGGVVLCGGKSSRMGHPKLALPFGSELLLQRVVRILSEVCSPIVVVAGPTQVVPPLPETVRLLRDESEFLGPLAGMGIGLNALKSEVAAAFVTSCDVPLLQPKFVRAVCQRLGRYEVAVPREGEFYHPLAGVYRTSLVGKVKRLVAEGRLRPLFLIQDVDSVEVPADELRAVDPELQSLRNVNRPEDYQAALRWAGLA